MSLQSLPQLAQVFPDSARVSEDGVLSIAGHALPDLAKAYGTPLYIYDRQSVVQACQGYQQAFESEYTASKARILYASKAYLSPLFARLVTEQGLGLDVVSAGELLLARQAGVAPGQLSFHGNNKSEEELGLALELGVGRIVLDNWSELERLSRLARRLERRPDVLLRVAPDVETDTHPYLQTGHAASKFGFPLGNGEARAAALRILHEGLLYLRGLHAHTGTMLREVRPYQETCERLLTLAHELWREGGWWPEEMSPGGGWAVSTSDQEPSATVQTLARALQQTITKVFARLEPGLTVPEMIIEPGRSISARAGVALYRIGARKATPGGITYLFVDGGMGDNIRPALYDAHYSALAVEQATAVASEQVCIAGRYCESGDMLINSIALPHMQEGDLLALPTAGAYCLPLASNYNLVPRPAVILVRAGRVEVMERRETYRDLFARYQTTDSAQGDEGLLLGER